MLPATLPDVRVRQTTEVTIRQRADVGGCRRLAAGLAAQLGFDSDRISDISIVATELASNIVKHAGAGHMLIHADAFEQGLHIVAVDRGAGMHDVAACLEDGFSTAGTCGNGLGAAARLADTLDIFSRPGDGTIVAAVFGRNSRSDQSSVAGVAADWAIGAINLPLSGETRCGDDWLVHCDDHYATCVVVDGLGHGDGAARAAELATATARDCMACDVESMLQHMHARLRGTRGAAAAIARIDHRSGEVQFAGIGNISARIERDGENTQHMISLDGIVGAAARTVRVFSYRWHPSATLVMHSDGLTSRSSFSSSEPRRMVSPICQAARLWRDFSRGRDDATVLVLQPAFPMGARA
ncbi:MAG: serine/threonine protein kinase [Planctomycetota bacterium]|nr:MAG: serine/threonine protein kinase [Planctomycetota bacterium]